MIPLLRIIIGVQKKFSKGTVIFSILDPEESLEVGLLAHLSLPSTVGCIQNTTALSDLSSVSHLAAGSCLALLLTPSPPVAYMPPRYGFPLLWTWWGHTAPPPRQTA